MVDITILDYLLVVRDTVLVKVLSIFSCFFSMIKMTKNYRYKCIYKYDMLYVMVLTPFSLVTDWYKLGGYPNSQPPAFRWNRNQI